MSCMKPKDAIGAKARPFTGAEYLASLRDGREVFIYGDSVIALAGQCLAGYDENGWVGGPDPNDMASTGCTGSATLRRCEAVSGWTVSRGREDWLLSHLSMGKIFQ